jgi:hypothetical protein
MDDMKSPCVSSCATAQRSGAAEDRRRIALPRERQSLAGSTMLRAMDGVAT